MRVARFRVRVLLMALLVSAVSWGGLEETQAGQRSTKRSAAATRRARRAAATRARARASRRAAPETTRRNVPVVIGTRDVSDPAGPGPVGPIGPAVSPNNDGPQPPRPGQPPAPDRSVIRGGILNGKAISKPAPAYPAIARAARASGTVTVQITVDEEGNVIAANPVSGHPLLQQSAAAAVRQWKFTPTLLSGRPVKVTGVVTVNYNLQ